jgi:SAM-dependent methyltransferase
MKSAALTTRMPDHRPTPAVAACPSCTTRRVDVFYELEGVPANSCILLSSPEEAREYARGSVRLGFCRTCGFIFNTAFDPELAEYSSRYETTQAYSPTFAAFQRRIAAELVERYSLRGRKVIEIGCGRGEFSSVLVELGVGEAVGFDPSHVASRGSARQSERVRFVDDYYSDKYFGEQADLICCKMTLAHIASALDFVTTVRRSIGERRDSVAYFLVPDAHRILRDLAFEDVYYEHCSYFSRGSLARLLARAGFETLRLTSEFGGQYLGIEARPSVPVRSIAARDDDLTAMTELVRFFSERVANKVDRWRGLVQDAVGRGRRVVLWGAGSKAVSLLTALGLGGEIAHVVDINPYRQGCYVPITAQRIVAPDFLTGYRPDLVIVMNAVYLPEIENMLAGLDLSPELRAL